MRETKNGMISGKKQRMYEFMDKTRPMAESRVKEETTGLTKETMREFKGK